MARRGTKSWVFGDPTFLELSVDAEGLLEFSDEVDKKQMPFAISLALNKTAKHAMTDLQRRLPASFVTRGKFTERSIKMSPSDKRDLVAKVGSIQPYMRLQALGGDRPTKQKSQSIPIGARPTKTKPTRPSVFPGKILDKGKAAVFTLRHKNRPALWKILGGKKRKNQRLKLMYSFQPSVKVQKEWELKKQIERKVKQVFSAEMFAALKQALATAYKTAKKKRGSSNPRR